MQRIFSNRLNTRLCDRNKSSCKGLKTYKDGRKPAENREGIGKVANLLNRAGKYGRNRQALKSTVFFYISD